VPAAQAVQVEAPAALVEPAKLQQGGGWAGGAVSRGQPGIISLPPDCSTSTIAKPQAHQASHAVLAVLGLVLAGQTLQLSKPAWDCNSPAAQFSHAVWSALAKVPAAPMATGAKVSHPGARTVQACKRKSEFDKCKHRGSNQVGLAITGGALGALGSTNGAGHGDLAVGALG
jgi:hypothetical protein